MGHYDKAYEYEAEREASWQKQYKDILLRGKLDKLEKSIIFSQEDRRIITIILKAQSEGIL